MSQDILSQLSPDKPFFGGNTYGAQCTIWRHLVMSSLVSSLQRPRINILEVGSWTGHSALTWAESIKAFCPEGGSILCVDPWADYMAAEDIQKGGAHGNMTNALRTGLAYELFCYNIKFSAPGIPISHIRAPFTQVSDFLKPNGFDLVFIDGSHYQEDVRRDIQKAKSLVAPGGYLVGDDLELQFGQCDFENAKKHPRTDYIQDPTSGISFHPGVTVAVWEEFGTQVWANQGTWAMKKQDDGSFLPPDFTQSRVLVPTHFDAEARMAAARALGIAT